MKHEWRKQEKEIYLPKNAPVKIRIPEFGFFSIRGKGNPNDETFPEYIGVLYALSYAVKMSPKKGNAPDGYFDYAVYPLEGIWDISEEARAVYKGTLDKNERINDGTCVQMLHLGSYDEEPESFERMEDFARQLKLVRTSKVHREIYLNDARKVEPARLKTVLRFTVENQA